MIRIHQKRINGAEDETTIGEVLSVDGDIVYQDGGTPTRLAASTATNQFLSLSTATDGLVPAWDYGGVAMQVVTTAFASQATATEIIPVDDTVPDATEGFAFMTQGIEPLATGSRLRIDVTAALSNGSDVAVVAALFRDSATAATGGVVDSPGGADNKMVMTFSHFTTAVATATTTFTVRVGPASSSTVRLNADSGSQFFGGAVSSSRITITELR